jgi:glycosyltransferase involved in cell wall biosynthesis
MTQNNEIEFSIIIETYNLEEGSSWERLSKAISAALSMAAEENNGEVIVTDVSGSKELEKRLRRAFPKVRIFEASGLGYDDAKSKAAREAANGKYILFLDGDCIPSTNWHQYLLNGLKKGDAIACAGYTRYDNNGLLFDLMTIMDWGFFYPIVKNKNLGCYAFNNFGVVKGAFDKFPIPKGDIRCQCYMHAQQMLRCGIPVKFIPEAAATHELPPVIRERTRRGYDTILSCQMDPTLPEARWLRWGIFSVPFFYQWVVRLDIERIYLAKNDLKPTAWKLALIILLFPIFRLLDVAGMLRAFLYAPSKGGWGGFSTKESKQTP